MRVADTRGCRVRRTLVTSRPSRLAIASRLIQPDRPHSRDRCTARRCRRGRGARRSRGSPGGTARRRGRSWCCPRWAGGHGRIDDNVSHCILPTPALPGQVRTVDGPSCPLSALGVRSRVWTRATLAQGSVRGNRNCLEMLCIANICVLCRSLRRGYVSEDCEMTTEIEMTKPPTGGGRRHGSRRDRAPASADGPRPPVLQVDRAVQHHAGHAVGVDQRVDRADLTAGDLPRHRAEPAGTRQRQLPALDAHGLPRGDRGARGVLRPSRRHVRPGPHLQPRIRRLHRSRRSRCPSIRSTSAAARCG